jgi:hypothetical protein
LEKGALEISQYAIRSMGNPSSSNAALAAADIKCLFERVESIAHMPEEKKDVPMYGQVRPLCQVANLKSGDGASENRLRFIKRELIDRKLGSKEDEKDRQKLNFDRRKLNFDRQKDRAICTNGYTPGEYRCTQMLPLIKPIPNENVDDIKHDGVYVWLKCLDNVSSNIELLREFYSLSSKVREIIKREFAQLSKQFKRAMTFQMIDEESCTWDDLRLGMCLYRSQNGQKMVHVGPNEGLATTCCVLM